VTVTEALELARSQGVEVTLDGDDLVLEAQAAPPPGLLAILGRGKWDIVPPCASARLRSAVASCSGSTTTSLHRHPASAPIAATGCDQRTLSFSCLSETIGARHTPHVIQCG
jgi:hypothetical protein